MNDEIAKKYCKNHLKNSNKKNTNQIWQVKISIGVKLKKNLDLVKRITMKLKNPLIP
jgi:lipopolysaccharide assembly outer membrane protein LptD (OstA)